MVEGAALLPNSKKSGGNQASTKENHSLENSHHKKEKGTQQDKNIAIFTIQEKGSRTPNSIPLTGME